MKKLDTFFVSGATGKNSSKRICGIILLAIGGGLLTFIALFAIFQSIKDADTAINCAKTLIFIGAGLLGFGVFDGIGLKIGGKK